MSKQRAFNCAGGSAEGYRMHSAGASWQPSSQDSEALGKHPSEVNARVIVSSAARLPQVHNTERLVFSNIVTMVVKTLHD